MKLSECRYLIVKCIAFTVKIAIILQLNAIYFTVTLNGTQLSVTLTAILRHFL